MGDAIEIEALQRTLERPIVIVRSKNLITLPDNTQYYEGAPIFLYYDGAHYDSLIITGNQTSKEILDNIISSFAKNTLSIEKTSNHESCCEFHENLIQAQQNLKSTDASSNQQIVINREDFFEQLSMYLPSFLIEELNFSNDILGDQL